MNVLPSIVSDITLYGGLAVIAFLLLREAIFTVNQQEVGLVSRFGKYDQNPRSPGLQFKIPFIDHVDNRVSMTLQSIPANLDTKTTDDQFVQLPIAIQFSVRDAEKYHYDSAYPNEQINNIVTAEVRKYTSQKSFQELYDERQEISDTVIESVKIELLDYGIDVKRIVIDEPQPDHSTKQAYNDVRASERRTEAATNDAQAAYIKMVKAAEADQKRNELIGEGVKSFRKSIAESYIETRMSLIKAGVDEAAADAFMSEAMRLDTLRDVGEKGNTIVLDLKNNKGSEVLPQVLAALKVDENRELPYIKPTSMA